MTSFHRLFTFGSGSQNKSDGTQINTPVIRSTVANSMTDSRNRDIGYYSRSSSTVRSSFDGSMVVEC